MSIASLSPYPPHFSRSLWENEIVARATSKHLSDRSKVVSIIAMVLALAVTTWLTPVHMVVLHNILHHLNILPLMLAGMLFGWRGAVQALLLATVLQSPAIYRHTGTPCPRMHKTRLLSSVHLGRRPSSLASSLAHET